MSKTAEFYYGADNVQKGPFSREQIMTLVQGGAITASTPVWSPGMANWLPFAQTPLAQDSVIAGVTFPPTPLTRTTISRTEEPVTSFGEAVTRSLSKYVTFSGRANRPEFWYTMLGIMLVGIAASILDLAIFGLNSQYAFFVPLFTLGVLLPELAVMVRRLHDTDRSGWWLLFMAIPLVGPIVLIVFWCEKGTAGLNRFGL